MTDQNKTKTNLTDVWSLDETKELRTSGGFGVRLDEYGVVFWKKSEHEEKLGSLRDVLFVFEQKHIGKSAAQILTESKTSNILEGTVGGIVAALNTLPQEDILGLWALLVLQENTEKDSRISFIFAWPDLKMETTFSLHKKETPCFEGRVFDFVMGGILTNGLEQSFNEKNRLASSMPKLFFHYQFKYNNYGGRQASMQTYKMPVDELIAEAVPVFTELMAKKPLIVSSNFHVLFEVEDVCKKITNDLQFLTFWRTEGFQRNGGAALHSLIASNMAVKDKKKTAALLANIFTREDILNAWRHIKQDAIAKHGVFRSWFAVGAGLGLSQKDCVQYAGFEISDVLAKRMKNPSEWREFLPLFKESGSFGLDRKDILSAIWNEMAGSGTYYNARSLTSSFEEGLEMLREQGITSKHFDHHVFFNDMNNLIEQHIEKNNLTADYEQQRETIFSWGQAMIDKILLSDRILPEESQRKTAVRKM